MTKRSHTTLIVFAIVFLSACASNAPPNLSPQAAQAWRGTRVIHVLDVFRDAAIDANAQTPPLLSTDLTRSIVKFHAASLEIVKNGPTGWIEMLRLGLREVQKRLTGRERELLDPYVTLVLAVLGG